MGTPCKGPKVCLFGKCIYFMEILAGEPGVARAKEKNEQSFLGLPTVLTHSIALFDF